MHDTPGRPSGGDHPVALDEFRAMMRDAGVEEVVEATLEAFVEETPERLDQLIQAFAESDAENLAQAAHAMKSAAGSIRADRLAELLATLEETGKRGDMTQAAELIEPVRNENDAVMRFLEGIIRG